MTLHLTPDLAADLTTLAAARGLPVEQYLREIVERELAATQADGNSPAQMESGMIVENGLLIYGAGTALPASVIDDAGGRSREERFQHVLGSQS